MPLIAFSAALQNTSFSNIGPWQFNSAMTTSNLRNAVSGWVHVALGGTDPKLRGEAIVGSVISLCLLLARYWAVSARFAWGPFDSSPLSCWRLPPRY